MKITVYERLVADALQDLPEDLRSEIHNLAIVIEDRPSREQLRAAGLKPPATLFGLYQGIPLKVRGAWYGNVLPDKITIFRRVIESHARDSDDVTRIVRETVLHEIGHYFGLGEERLRQIEADWRAREA
jgi:predicted Zn-dependent protease with MMP-like domain